MNKITDDNKRIEAAFSKSAQDLLDELHSSAAGLSQEEAQKRLETYGENKLPRPKPSGLLTVFIRQFLNPLIYILLIAAIVSYLLGETTDAIFIAAVLILNAIIGTAQEYSAEKSASALQSMVTTNARIIRTGENYEVNSTQLVPGDIVLIESGDKVPADMRLLHTQELAVDEALLTGESVPVTKHADTLLEQDTLVADRINLAHAGTHVTRGRATGLVINTGLRTEIGKIAEEVIEVHGAKPPLLLRMERFTTRIAIIVGIVVSIMVSVSLLVGEPFEEVFIAAVALSVSAIPEGLPVALTIALAIGMRRMAKRNVIVRKLMTVEALGSCTFIASDKTGTLTQNQITATHIVFPDDIQLKIGGSSTEPDGEFSTANGSKCDFNKQLKHLCITATLANEGYLARRNNHWISQGDAVDIALLIMAHKAGISKASLESDYEILDSLPFESERAFSAALYRCNSDNVLHIKGAIEKLLPLCNNMMTQNGTQPIDTAHILQQAAELARAGYRVLAFVSGTISYEKIQVDTLPNDLCFLGIVGMIDPLREGVVESINECHNAGLGVAMVTGDHPITALAIAKDLDLASSQDEVVTGSQLKTAKNRSEIESLTKGTRVFARVEPDQKLQIVQTLANLGHYVAVTGDGANDAPALRSAHVGVAMGKSGTDVAREVSDMIITDDHFNSIIAGIEEGRIAYNNVRKVIFLLISTGAAEIVLFILSMLFGLPLPLHAVQLLWLNLVTNGIQDIALAFEPGEGDELKKPPRQPNEAIFNRLMIERVVLSAITIGVLAFIVFRTLTELGYNLEEARNGTLLLMVLFENVQVLNSRSETKSAFRKHFFNNPLLIYGTIIAQLVHIGAMFTPGIQEVLRVNPISFTEWLIYLGIALILLVVMEAHKLLIARKRLI